MSTPETSPLNSLAKRLPEKEFIALFALMMSLTALSMDAVLPAFPDITQAFLVTDYHQTQWIVTGLVFGMVFGEIIFGPLSDAIGRRKTILIGVGIYALGTVMAMTAQSLPMLLLGRVVQGIGVAGPKIASRALIRDLYKGAAMARIMSYVMVIFILVPMLAPWFGQKVMLLGGWRWIFVAFLVQATIATLWFVLRQGETLAKQQRQPFRPSRLIRDARNIFQRIDVVCYIAITGCVFSGMLLYLSIAQSIFQDIYGTGEDFPLYFALLSCGAGVASFTNGNIVMRLGMALLVKAALILLATTSVVMLTSALVHQGVPPLWLFLTLGVLVFFCQGLLFGNINAMAMEPLGRTAGLGAAIVSASSSLIGVMLSSLVGLFYADSVTPLACGFLIFSSTSLVLLHIAKRFPSEK
ncbi:multidrug effflux MFS transporter [Marinomonas pollencensis]|uniref:DHA1 family bicyclomycin/chloramphenicol resistance-like MFS transporter n=1 Tax=Marinomonas pollencensis TaxID=491954 RepID=A0A3E0DI29_9GAMM|nr:multidrug effflux MFS transporter [Marinomonas pollencensis]REG82371.1 DHA1 family bicyclomycin/chloramphenicol resistance-like MFS transporter [Marinomonas pollencensis]